MATKDDRYGAVMVEPATLERTIAQMKDRAEHLRSRIAELKPLEQELRTLERMLASAEMPTRGDR